MNLRIEGQHWRFRISRDELEMLCHGRQLSQHSELPDERSMSITIQTDHLDEKNLLLECNESGFTLLINPVAASTLFNALPSRDGLESVQKISESHTLRLSLEVDIRTQKRKRG